MDKIILIPVQRILNNNGKLNDAANHWVLIMVKDFVISYIDSLHINDDQENPAKKEAFPTSTYNPEICRELNVYG